MSSLFSLLMAVVAGYLLLAGWVYLRQDSMVYHPHPVLETTPAAIGLDYDDIRLTTADGVSIHGWFVPGPDAPCRVVLFCHGNAGNIAHRLDSLKIFHDMGLSVLMFDYRGFGQSEGKPTEPGTYLDAEAVWEHLVTARGFKPSEVIVFGRSLGGAVASHIAAQKPAAALILESTFTSLPDLGAKFYPYLPVRLLARHRYNNIKHLQKVRCPVLVVHSSEDELIPFEHGKALYAAAPEPKMFVAISGGHNSGFLTSGTVYVDGMRSFLEQDVFEEIR